VDPRLLRQLHPDHGEPPDQHPDRGHRELDGGGPPAGDDRGLAADYDADGDGRPDELDRLAISQRLDDLRVVIAELERELRITKSDG